ncbi:alpha/beta fold hydrolase, partial [Rhodococcus aerolatus]
MTSTTGPAAPAPGGAVVLPGTGSDGRFARAAFGPALDAAGVAGRFVDPTPGGVVRGYRAALDAAARRGPVLVAGVSLGALVGLTWAAEHPGQVAGLALALPPWSGAGVGGPDDARAVATT